MSQMNDLSLGGLLHAGPNEAVADCHSSLIGKQLYRVMPERASWLSGRPAGAALWFTSLDGSLRTRRRDSRRNLSVLRMAASQGADVEWAVHYPDHGMSVQLPVGGFTTASGTVVRPTREQLAEVHFFLARGMVVDRVLHLRNPITGLSAAVALLGRINYSTYGTFTLADSVIVSGIENVILVSRPKPRERQQATGETWRIGLRHAIE